MDEITVYKTKNASGNLIEIDKIRGLRYSPKGSSDNIITVSRLENKSVVDIYYATYENMLTDYKEILRLLNKKLNNEKEIKNKMIDSLKKYFKKHEDTIITIGIVVLLDHFVFNGAFREKLKNVVNNLISSVSKKLEK